MNGIYIMSSERSGSNLLRSILNAHSEISAPSALQLFRQFSPIVHLYGNLSKTENLENLVEDVLLLVNLKGTKTEWDEEITKRELLNRIKYPSLVEVVVEVYSLYASKKGANYFVCKENDLYDHLFKTLHHYPTHKFIYLVRDGRDVAVSERSIPFRKRHIFALAESWKKEQQRALSTVQDTKPNNVFLVKYEELLSNTNHVLEDLFSFLEIKFEKEVLSFHQKKESKNQSNKSEFWTNLSSPMMKDNFSKYKKKLSEKEIRVFESVCRVELIALSYKLEFPEQLRISRLNDLYYRINNKIMKFVNGNDKKSFNHHLINNKAFLEIKKHRYSSIDKIK
tara:strand:- start:769 stop:1782 length:1014 start_codon:yes stop_codon:yes gene_type:complete